MPQRILIFVTSLAVMIYAVLGCCAHHIHAVETEAHVASVHSEGVSQHQEHHCYHSKTAHDDDESHDSQPEPCDEVDCRFLVSSRLNEWENSLFDFASELYCPRQVAELSQLQSQYDRQNSHSDLVLCDGPPLRLLKQLWLL